MAFKKSTKFIVSYILKNKRHQTLIPVPYDVNISKDNEVESYVREQLNSELGGDLYEGLIII